MAQASAVKTHSSMAVPPPIPESSQTVRLYALVTDTGRVRNMNEDCGGAIAEHGVFVVCDGMGGAAAGEVASQLARDTFLSSIAGSAGAGREVPARLEEAVRLANQAVHRQAQRTRSLRGMGTTLVSVLFEGSAVWVAHVGDSRCYRLRNGALEQLTRDHSLIEEQIQAGMITRKESMTSPVRNIITRAVGSASIVHADIAAHALEPGDVFLLATDGLTRELDDEAIALELRSSWTAQGNAASMQAGLERTCKALIDDANSHGGADNITVLMVCAFAS